MPNVKCSLAALKNSTVYVIRSRYVATWNHFNTLIKILGGREKAFINYGLVMFVKLKIVRTLTSQRILQGASAVFSRVRSSPPVTKKKKEERKLNRRDKGSVVAWKKDQS